MQNQGEMRVTGAKQQYDELIAARSWDKETQIRFFLEYAEEYQLSAHFFVISGIKANNGRHDTYIFR